ncbi:MAG TPA: hypothetical protein VNT79_01105 [Phycisphaerae bacterium]|nr:hypothetical protein [Phycisphaerae bacterium]
MPDSKVELWSHVKTAMVVTGITVLIWLAADQNVADSEEYAVIIRLNSAEPDRYAGFAEAPYQRSFTVRLRGRRNRLHDFGRLNDGSGPFVAVIDKSIPASPEPRVLSVEKDILSNVKQIRESRLTIDSVEPESVTAIVDEYTTVHDIRVKPDYGDLRVTPEFLRSNVSAKVPRFIAAMLGDPPVATAVPQQSIQSMKKPDGSFEVQGTLQFDGLDQIDPSLRVEFEPSNVMTIAGRSEAMTATESKGPIQTNWAIPDEVQRQYAVVADQANFRVYIDVTGPTDRLSQLDPRQIRAFIDVLAGDIDTFGPGKEIVREVRFILPPEFPDCTISPEAQSHQIRFRLEPRPAGSLPANSEVTGTD